MIQQMASISTQWRLTKIAIWSPSGSLQWLLTNRDPDAFDAYQWRLTNRDVGAFHFRRMANDKSRFCRVGFNFLPIVINKSRFGRLDFLPMARGTAGGHGTLNFK